MARIYIGGKRRYLGLFVLEVDAALAYDEAARELYGEFAALNVPKVGEQSAHRAAPPEPSQEPYAFVGHRKRLGTGDARRPAWP
jgi:hypothetical protein